MSSAGSSSTVVDSSEIDLSKSAELGNKEPAAGRSFTTGEIGGGVTKPELGYKEVNGLGMVTERSWLSFVFLIKPPPGAMEEIEAQPTATVGGITKQRVPDSFIDKLKNRRLFQKLPRVNVASNLYTRFPDLRDLHLSITNRRNYCIDLHEDVVRQYKEKGFAEVGVDFTDGVKKIFILPQPQEPQPEVTR